jgi:hypothetical protein
MTTYIIEINCKKEFKCDKNYLKDGSEAISYYDKNFVPEDIGIDSVRVRDGGTTITLELEYKTTKTIVATTKSELFEKERRLSSKYADMFDTINTDIIREC